MKNEKFGYEGEGLVDVIYNECEVIGNKYDNPKLLYNIYKCNYCEQKYSNLKHIQIQCEMCGEQICQKCKIDTEIGKTTCTKCSIKEDK